MEPNWTPQDTRTTMPGLRTVFHPGDSEARYGCWRRPGKPLRLKGIPFDRESSGYYGFIPEHVIFGPAPMAPRRVTSFSSSAMGHPHLTAGR